MIARPALSLCKQEGRILPSVNIGTSRCSQVLSRYRTLLDNSEHYALPAVPDKTQPRMVSKAVAEPGGPHRWP